MAGEPVDYGMTGTISVREISAMRAELARLREVEIALRRENAELRATLAVFTQHHPGATAHDIRELTTFRTYVRDVCVRCGHTIERAGPRT